MSGPPRIFVFIASLGLTLSSGPAFGQAPPPAPGASPADSGASTSTASPGSDYVFPSARDQFRSWAMNAIGPSAIAGSLVGASWRQWVTDEPAEWDDDGKGFAQRFGTGSLATAINETALSLASAAMRQDAGYYRSPRSGLVPRLRHALAMTVMARAPDGRAVFSPGKTFSPFVGPLVTQTSLYPDRYDYTDGLVSGAYGLLVNAGWNAVREFVLESPGW